MFFKFFIFFRTTDSVTMQKYNYKESISHPLMREFTLLYMGVQSGATRALEIHIIEEIRNWQVYEVGLIFVENNQTEAIKMPIANGIWLHEQQHIEKWHYFGKQNLWEELKLRHMMMWHLTNEEYNERKGKLAFA